MLVNEALGANLDDPRDYRKDDVAVVQDQGGR